jgi:16S rRNA (guanine1207-N2)-methyltransferase
MLLGEHVEVAPHSTILNLNAGAGLAGASVAMTATDASVIMTDRNLVNVEAARRTVVANHLKNVAVHFSNGLCDLPLRGPVDYVVIRLPKGCEPALQLLWDGFHALKIGGTCYLAGANREGIKTAIERMRQLFGNGEVTGYKGGHRIARSEKRTLSPVDSPADDVGWLDHQQFRQFPVEIAGHSVIVCSRPGVFAWDRLDEGTRLLVEHMRIEPEDTVLDLGCGTGIVGVVSARIATRGKVVLVDTDAEAIRSATRSIQANGLTHCTVLTSDAGSAVEESSFDVVVTNPPFHVGRRAEFDVAHQFIRDAWDVLRPGGRLYLVANSRLPYEKTIRDCFGSLRVECETHGYKVLSAGKNN